MKSIGLIVEILLALLFAGNSVSNAADPNLYEKHAREVTDYIQKTFWDSHSGLYAKSATDRSPDTIWSNGVMFSALVAAGRHEPKIYLPVMEKFFLAMDAYWDRKAKIPGYEPVPTGGNTHDKYYDDNAWMVITFLESYELTRDARYLSRAEQTLNFVLNGWDEQIGGGIWWHETHKDGTKNTCANAPAAVGCLRLAKFSDPPTARQLADESKKIVDWTVAALQSKDGLFEDRKVVATGEVKHGKLTYNSALMIRAFLGLYRLTGKNEYLKESRRIAKAADLFLDNKTGVYKDHVQWTHLMVEADLELYRFTKDDYLLQRAKNNADFYYNNWKANPPGDTMSNASISRVLWLMADRETDIGRAFWEESDK